MPTTYSVSIIVNRLSHNLWSGGDRTYAGELANSFKGNPYVQKIEIFTTVTAQTSDVIEENIQDASAPTGDISEN
jgi:hypothetical protein